MRTGASGLSHPGGKLASDDFRNLELFFYTPSELTAIVFIDGNVP
jgi:hypothetical protein